MAVTKTDGGRSYPAAAYAYVPDPESPSTWKLRLWDEKGLSLQMAGAAAAALSPGGFRGNRVEIPRADLGAVKAKIRSAYKKLDVTPEDIPESVREGTHAGERATFGDYEVARFSEAGKPYDKTKGIARIILIRPGFNNAPPGSDHSRYYSEDMLKREAKKFEGALMFADHPTESEYRARPEGSVMQTMGIVKGVCYEEGTGLVGDAHIHNPGMRETLSNMQDLCTLHEALGTSVIGDAVYSKGTVDGRR